MQQSQEARAERPWRIPKEAPRPLSSIHRNCSDHLTHARMHSATLMRGQTGFQHAKRSA